MITLRAATAILVLCAVSVAVGLPSIPRFPKPDRSVIPETKTVELRNFHRSKSLQQGPVSCWAACAEMVHHHARRRGPEYSQERIVQRITGVNDPNDPDARGASTFEIMRALDPDTDINVEGASKIITNITFGRDPFEGVRNPDKRISTLVTTVFTYLDDAPIVQSLDEKRQPVVLLLKPGGQQNFHHAVVVYGVTYTKGGIGIGTITGSPQLSIKSYRVADPLPPDGNWGIPLPDSVPAAELKGRIERVLTRESAQATFKAINEFTKK